MTATQHAVRNAYPSAEAAARTPRSLEYSLLAQITHRLSAAWALKKEDYSGFAGALNDNLRMWTTLASDVAESTNGLPAPLRAQLFYLYEFTAAHSRAILDNRGSVEVLLEINTAVMRGLRGDGGGA